MRLALFSVSRGVLRPNVFSKREAVPAMTGMAAKRIAPYEGHLQEASDWPLALCVSRSSDRASYCGADPAVESVTCQAGVLAVRLGCFRRPCRVPSALACRVGAFSAFPQLRCSESSLMQTWFASAALRQMKQRELRSAEKPFRILNGDEVTRCPIE